MKPPSPAAPISMGNAIYPDATVTAAEYEASNSCRGVLVDMYQLEYRCSASGQPTSLSMVNHNPLPKRHDSRGPFWGLLAASRIS